MQNLQNRVSFGPIPVWVMFPVQRLPLKMGHENLRKHAKTMLVVSACMILEDEKRRAVGSLKVLKAGPIRGTK